MVKHSIVAAAGNAIRSLHMIMTDSTEEQIVKEYQKMINVLFTQFPTAAARPSYSKDSDG